MPLHRDIHWIGRQWAVTGHGVQLIDQKLQGFFDIEVSKLWDDDVIESMFARDWVNAADFDKAIAVARARYQQPPGAATRPRDVVPPATTEPVAPLAPVAKLQRPETSTPEKPDPVEPPPAPPSPPLTLFQMQYQGRARFVRPWRVVARKI
jgi:hypothetical protein